jgi:hypothetical protein
MTFKVLTEEGTVIHRAVVRSATGKRAFINQRANESAEGSPVEQGTYDEESDHEKQSEMNEEEYQRKRMMKQRRPGKHCRRAL